MFTAMALNQNNIVKVGPGPPAVIRVPARANVIVGRAWKDVFATSAIPGLVSSSQVVRVRPVRGGIRVRALAVRGDGRNGTRVIVAGALAFAITYMRSDGLVGFILLELPVSALVDLPGVEFREGVQAEAEVSVTTVVWDGPPGPTLGGLVRLDVSVTREDTIVLIALPPAAGRPYVTA